MTDQTINVTIGGDTINATIGGDTIKVTLQGGIALSHVNEDVKLRFDGATGDTYLLYNSTTGKLELWVDGVKKAAWG